MNPALFPSLAVISYLALFIPNNPDNFKGSVLFVLTAVLYIIFISFHLDPLLLLSLSFLLTVSIHASFKDIRLHYIHYTDVILILAGTLSTFFISGNSIITGIISAGAGFLVMGAAFLITRGNGLGIADVFLFSIFCLLLAPEKMPVFLGLSCLSAIPSALYCHIKKTENKAIPFVPYITASAFIMFAVDKVSLSNF